jgi:hypothetical protein
MLLFIGRSSLGSISFPCFDADGAGGAGGGDGAAGAGTGAAGSGAGAADAGAGAAGAGAAGAAGGAGDNRTGGAASGKQFTYTEDRSTWIPPHRFREVSTKQSELQKEAERLKREVEDRDTKIKAFLGGGTDPKTQKVEQTKEAFFELFPRMKKFFDMKDEEFEQLFEAPKHLSRVSESEQRESARHGRQVMSTINTSLAETLGQEKLSDDQAADVQTAFASWFERTVKKEVADTGNSPTLEAYEAGDPALLQGFVEKYTERWLKPAGRVSTLNTSQRVRQVPNSGGRTQVTTSVKRPDAFKTLDERIDYAAEVAKERGLVFGR